ncbi:MAG: hypothetical protein FJ086_09905 [Deltaproteobacteria bacterium]|nr:hypothetical protein [Deltaproteobacteria bacterium]
MRLRGLALAAVLPGCALVPPQVGAPAPVLADASAERAYQSALGRATARDEVYAGLDTRLFTAATHQSTAFRAARTRRLAAFEGWFGEALQAALQREVAEAEQGNDFLLGMYVPDRREESLDGPRSGWRVALELPDGTQLLPTAVERLGRGTLRQRALYPYLGDFWVAYRVRFPRARPDGRDGWLEGAPGFVLKVGSTLGQARLRFPGEPGGGAGAR